MELIKDIKAIAGDKVEVKNIQELFKIHCSKEICRYAKCTMTIDYVGSNLYKMREDDQKFIWRDYHISKLISKGCV